jgi:hypothetical protein
MDFEMKQKDIAVKLIEDMPGESTFEDIMYLLFIRKKLFDGLKDINNGDVFEHDDIKSELKESTYMKTKSLIF